MGEEIFPRCEMADCENGMAYAVGYTARQIGALRSVSCRENAQRVSGPDVQVAWSDENNLKSKFQKFRIPAVLAAQHHYSRPRGKGETR
jgi:hypothetical protein